MTAKKYGNLNFRPSPEVVDGLNDVVEYLRSNNPYPDLRVTKTDALRYLIRLFREKEEREKTGKK